MKAPHQFTVTVYTDKTKAAAKSAILCAFASRQPDACSFHLKEVKADKAAAQSSRETIDNLVSRLTKARKAVARLKKIVDSLPGSF